MQITVNEKETTPTKPAMKISFYDLCGVCRKVYQRYAAAVNTEGTDGVRLQPADFAAFAAFIIPNSALAYDKKYNSICSDCEDEKKK